MNKTAFTVWIKPDRSDFREELSALRNREGKGTSIIQDGLTSSKNAESANYPFCTIEPNVGVVAVPDERLNELAKSYNTIYPIASRCGVFAKTDITSPKVGKVVLTLASVTFDVYIIHCYELLTEKLYVNILHADKYYESPYLILHFFGSVLLIYGVSTVIGLVQSKLFDKPFRFVSGKAGDFAEYIEKRFIK